MIRDERYGRERGLPKGSAGRERINGGNTASTDRRGERRERESHLPKEAEWKLARVSRCRPIDVQFPWSSSAEGSVDEEGVD
jgi:hypothetical protein